jgi:hypothetical protein
VSRSILFMLMVSMPFGIRSENGLCNSELCRLVSLSGCVANTVCELFGLRGTSLKDP